jgi:simple sugar transport system ATP-binding protein
LAVTEEITVMRRGTVTGRVKTARTNEVELANMMVGRSVVLQVEKPPPVIGEIALQVSHLSAKNERDLPALNDVSFFVRRGEIVGIAGVEGNGQTELVEVISGLRSGISGQVFLNGKEITKASIRSRRISGMAHIPENRLLIGVSKTCSIQENLILNKYYSKDLSDWFVLNNNNIRQFSTDLVKRFSIKTPDARLPVDSLSGGNMQKVILARELDSDPGLLIAAQPTRGVDVGAIEYIHKQLISLRDLNRAILLVSAELDEIIALSDRILVLYEGEIVGEFVGGQVSENDLGLYMTGSKRMDPLPVLPA